MLTNEYIAGIFDGEGWIHVSRQAHDRLLVELEQAYGNRKEGKL